MSVDGNVDGTDYETISINCLEPSTRHSPPSDNDDFSMDYEIQQAKAFSHAKNSSSVNKLESKLFRKKPLANPTTSGGKHRSSSNNNSRLNNNNHNNNNNNLNNNNNNNEDSFDSSLENKPSSANMSLSISSSESDLDGLDDEDNEGERHFFRGSLKNEDEDDDYETDELLHVTYPRLHISKKPVSNSLHSIKERERRDTLKKLFSRLKMSMFLLTHEIDTIYDEDTEVKRLKEELNNANLNPRMKSKQRTLHEVN